MTSSRHSPASRHPQRPGPNESARLLVRGPGTALALLVAVTIAATPSSLVAQAPAVAVTVSPATYVDRAASTAGRASANVTRAESVTADDPAAPAAPAAVRSSAPAAGTATDSVPAGGEAADPIGGVTPAAEAPRAPTRAGEKSAPLLSFDREIYSYSAEGRRDPFKSLMATGDLRPLISDLRLVAVAFDPDGASVAILRDTGTNEQYRVRAGQQLGRMRVAAIQSRKVVFTIEEFGFSRQESLALGDPNNARTQR